MVWTSEGIDHEGYLVCVLRDVGDVASAASPTSSEVVGWAVECRCAALLEPVLLRSVWKRVWDPKHEDVTAGLIYVEPSAGAGADDVAGREDVGPLFFDVWQEHVAMDSALVRIHSLGQNLRKLDIELTAAVATARTLGLSWRNIGKAFGITRQGAQRRWKTVSGAERTTP